MIRRQIDHLTLQLADEDGIRRFFLALAPVEKFESLYRVRVGPFAQKGMADATRDQLDANGVEAALVRVQR